MELYERAGGVGSSRVLNEHQPAQRASERAASELGAVIFINERATSSSSRLSSSSSRTNSTPDRRP